jgi:hypothetical protein
MKASQVRVGDKYQFRIGRSDTGRWIVVLLVRISRSNAAGRWTRKIAYHLQCVETGNCYTVHNSQPLHALTGYKNDPVVKKVETEPESRPIEEGQSADDLWVARIKEYMIRLQKGR